MPVTQLSTPKARIDVTIAGVAFTRSKADAARRDTTRRIEIEWDDVTGATIDTTSGGRSVIRVGVAAAPDADHHRHDPYAIKAQRGQTELAEQLVERINHEVAVRRRWREHSQATESG